MLMTQQFGGYRPGAAKASAKQEKSEPAVISTSLTRRIFASTLGAATLGFGTSASAQTDSPVQIGVPTKAYWPTVITLAALRQKFFEKEGITAEMTVYRGGAECFEALAAKAADIILDPPSLTALGLRRGVGSKVLANASSAYYGWHLLVRTDSPVQSVADLAGKKVGITSMGSGSDLLALWTLHEKNVSFTRVPVGGGGLVPNLRARNLDAAVIYSPLSFQMIRDKQARSLIDYSVAVPAHCTAGWIASDRIIQERPKAVQASMNALYGGLAWLRANREGAIALIAENNECSTDLATIEYEETTLKLAVDGKLDEAQIAYGLELSRLAGMTDMAPVSEIYTTRFLPHPTV
jgi:NitT/TauT family transport system substrate-binding protein